jgi:hypothetical protein
MDDLQFRRSIYADPNSQDNDMLSAQVDDDKKRALAKELQHFDDKIKAAIDVPLPEGLYDKLILRQTMASHQQAKRRSRIHLALAASVAIVAGVLVNFVMFNPAYQNQGDQALAHTYYEKSKYSNSDETNIDLISLNKKMATFKGSFKTSIGKLISADYCRFDGIKSLHLVYQGITSPVSIYVTPKNEQLAFSKTFHDSYFQGESIAYKESNIIIVADKNEPLNQWQQRIADNVSLSI